MGSLPNKGVLFTHCIVQCLEMAEKVIQSVEDELNCSICLDTYTDPKLLQCFHVFCRKCLVRLVDQDQQGQLTLSCPTCRQVTPVPANRVAGLQPAFLINHLLEIMEEHKKAATDPTASAERVERDSTSLAPSNKIEACCCEHVGKEVALYCEPCEKPICFKCAIKGGKHHSHDYEELDKAFEKYKVEISASLEPVEKQLTSTKKALAQLDTRCGEISDQQADIEADIHETFRQLQEILNARKTKLIHQLHHLTQSKLKRLAVERNLIETKQAQLNSCLAFMRESLKADSQGEVLRMKRDVVKQVKELSTFPADMLKPNTVADMVFSASNYVPSVCQDYGHVLAIGSPDPSKCLVTGSFEAAAVVGETSTAILHTVDFKRRLCSVPIQSSECELVSEITGTRIRGRIEKTGESRYQISYQPAVKGRHQLHITLGDQHVRESPFSVTAKSPVEELGTPIRMIRGVSRPWGVVINKRGEVVVTEQDVACVSVFSASGKKLLSFGTRGSDEGQFIHPSGVTTDGEGNIFIADWGNNRIQKFTATGQLLTAVGSQGSGPLQFSYPEGISFNLSNNKLYVTDNNHRVQVLNSDLTFSSTFGRHGSGRGQFYYPRGIACDSAGNVYVADFSNHCVQVFTAEGVLSRMFGRCGDEKDLWYPTAVALDASDMVYVSEFCNQCVSVFTSEGEFVTSFGSHGKQPGQFRSPCGVCVDDGGVVYVCDLYSCVQMF